MKYKKSIADFWLGFLLALVALVVLIAAFLQLSGKGFANIRGCIDNHDTDQLPDCEDSCPCTDGSRENKGCPVNYVITGNGKGPEDRSCLLKKT